jgi:hypothetical protein
MFVSMFTYMEQHLGESDLGNSRSSDRHLGIEVCFHQTSMLAFLCGEYSYKYFI